MKFRTVFAIFTAVVAISAAAANPLGQRWWRYVQELAGDKFEGRETASAGHRLAAEYVAAEFKRLGLGPAGTSGYRQPIPVHVRRIREEGSNLSLTGGGIQELLELGVDANFSLVGDLAPQLQAQAVFAGYGLTVPELNHDDLAGLDVRNKVVVFLRGGPASIPGPLRAHYQSTSERWAFLRRAGAIGMASILDPRSMDIPWERLTLLRLQKSMTLAGDEPEQAPGLRLAITINPASADKFFAGTGHGLPEILELAQAGKPLPKFPLARSIRAEVSVERSEAESENVIGILKGRDRRLREEYVVISAHLDHLGIGAPIGGDSIYKGAMDNAAGVASLFEIARALKASPPRRSVLLVAVTGEEKGLLGSKYFSAHAGVKPEALVANLNLDMFLPLHGLRALTVYGLEESSLGGDARAVARAFGVRIQTDPEPDRNTFIRSDQYSFIREGVPSLFFKFGYGKGSPEERLQKEWLKTRYHAPSDDASQPVNLAAAAKFNRLMAALAARIANQARRPQWNSSSFFRRFARGGV